MQVPSRFLAVCLPILSAVVAAQADEAPSTALSAHEFLVRVGTSHPSLPLLAAAVDEAAANARATGVWTNPSLSVDREEVFAGGRGQPENFVRLELPLEISGRRALRVRGAELGLDAARATSARDRATLLFEALGLYWRAASERRASELLRQERDGLHRLVQAVRSRTAAGDTSGYDLDRLEIEVQSLEDLIAEAERQLDGWRLRLGLLVGAPGARFDAIDPLALPARPPSLESLRRQLPARRGDHRAARLRVARAERELEAARRGWVPDLVLSGGAKTAEIDGGTAWGYVAGVSLTVPVFDHGQGEASQAHARLAQAGAARRLLEAHATTELVTAHAALTDALAQTARFEETQLPRLERLVRRAEVSYREGERPVFELLDAYHIARSIRLRQVELWQLARQADLDLAHAAGHSPGGSR